MNATVLGLGAGGSRDEMIPLVDKITAAGLSITAGTAIFGGSVTNKLGPRFAMLLATCGYPTFVAALWYEGRNSILQKWYLLLHRLLDNGRAQWFAWVATIWHGISAALLYPAAGTYLKHSQEVQPH